MPKLLLIESSGDVCSVAISQGDSVVAEKHVQEPNSHSTYLASFVDEVLQAAQITPKDLDAVVVGGGPGSYTGLRIGVSLAKGLCFGAGIPLIACSTLRALAVSALEENKALDTILSVIDARRMDAYLGVFNAQQQTRVKEHFVTLDKQLAVDYAKGKTIAVGSGAAKWVEEFELDSVLSICNSALYAKHLLPEALQKWEQKMFEDMAYYEPNYIKSVFVTKPKPKF
ncbi:MAG: tRNA (adenosine(37)-N6)-threonylcarbamoyltransferase complex dimerization subunit type 1 TsaB [Bacteroidetes bacterium]|jgi:tRNA threonylcarbamoyladenosine biosynthesis protein TsaB|nr:tRNA (adenosine(37)-N6)-threonylcarbamoyltransferase complex dimerization subunit type 1 TsaB [Bacteroidota bacterium]